VDYLEPTPPGVDLVVRSAVARVRESEQVGGGKASVEVALTLHQARRARPAALRLRFLCLRVRHCTPASV
jgi:hypothetical protein